MSLKKINHHSFTKILQILQINFILIFKWVISLLIVLCLLYCGIYQVDFITTVLCEEKLDEIILKELTVDNSNLQQASENSETDQLFEKISEIETFFMDVIELFDPVDFISDWLYYMLIAILGSGFYNFISFISENTSFVFWQVKKINRKGTKLKCEHTAQYRRMTAKHKMTEKENKKNSKLSIKKRRKINRKHRKSDHRIWLTFKNERKHLQISKIFKKSED